MSSYHVANDEHPGAPVSKSNLKGSQMAKRRLVLTVDNQGLALETENGETTLGLGQAFAVGREIQQDESSNNRPARSGSTLDNEEPSPTGEAMNTVQTRSDGTGEETAESTGENSSRDVDGESLGLLRLLVPRGEEKEDTGGETSLEDTDNDTETDKTVV